MKKLCLTVMLIASISIISSAQEKNNVKYSFYYGIGICGQNFSNLFNRISRYPQFEKPGNLQGDFVIGFQIFDGKYIVDDHLIIANSLSGNDGKKNTRLLSQGFYVKWGYNFSKNKNIICYPLIGVGMEAFEVTLNKDLSAVPFDTLLVSPPTQQQAESIHLSNMFFTYTLGMGIDFLKIKKYFRGIGIRAGYSASFSKRKWRVNENQLLANAPSDNLNRWFASMHFMFGSNKKIRRVKE